MFLIEIFDIEGSCKPAGALNFYNPRLNATIIKNLLARELDPKLADVQQQLVRSVADLMDWDTQAYHDRLVTRKTRRSSCNAGHGGR